MSCALLTLLVDVKESLVSRLCNYLGTFVGRVGTCVKADNRSAIDSAPRKKKTMQGRRLVFYDKPGCLGGLTNQLVAFRPGPTGVSGVGCSVAGRNCRTRLSRDQILTRERGQRNINFPCSADHEQVWQPYPVDPYPCYNVMDHTHILWICCFSTQ